MQCPVDQEGYKILLGFYIRHTETLVYGNLIKYKTKRLHSRETSDVPARNKKSSCIVGF
jgi:hypothetical protein